MDVDIISLFTKLPPTNKKEKKVDGTEVFTSFWKEKVYAEANTTTEDQRFFNNALKSSHIEGKMSAREMQFTRALGPPVSGNQ